MTATLTVSEIAGRIWRPTDSLTEAQVVERIRGWTKEGLLVPVGDKNPGPGRHRRYPYTAVGEAILLNVLTEAIGRMQAIKARAFHDVFQAAKEVLAKDATLGKLLVIGLASDGTAEINLTKTEGLPRLLASSGSAAHLIISLGKLS